MEQEVSVELLDSIKDRTIIDVELIDQGNDSLLKITFKDNESIVIAGYDMDIYFLTPKDRSFH